MIQLSELIGHDTVDVATAESKGRLKGIGLAGNRIVTVRIGDEVMAATAVRGFDGDVVTYDASGVVPYDASGVVPDGPLPADQQPNPGDPRGSRVLDVHGDQLGTLSDLTISDDGVVDTILLEGGHALQGSRLRAIGTYAAIVDAEG